MTTISCSAKYPHVPYTGSYDSELNLSLLPFSGARARATSHASIHVMSLSNQKYTTDSKERARGERMMPAMTTDARAARHFSRYGATFLTVNDTQ